MGKLEKKVVSINIDRGLWQKVKIAAINSGVSFSAFVEAILKQENNDA